MDVADAIRRREEYRRKVETSTESKHLEMELCRGSTVHWCWTYDPREPNPRLPFDLFPRQREFLRWLAERDALQQSGLAEKSRDVGFTWLCTAHALHCWLFHPGDSTGFGSRKLDLVDHRDNPDCIFEKIRYLLRNLPEWMQPQGFASHKHDKYCTLLNPENGSTITGEGGSEIGRGGRKSRYIVDEAAYLPNPKSVEAALSQTTRVRIDVSTPNGTGNPFHIRRFSGTVPVFTFHWRDDPRKDDAWYEREKLRINDPVIIAQELDIDYSASVENVCIPAVWVQSAIDHDLEVSGYRIGGWDVAGEGPCLNVLVVRHGPRVIAVRDWARTDLLQSAGRAIDICRELEIRVLNYDAIGVGAGVGGLFSALAAGGSLGFEPRALNVGEAPTGATWPDGKTSRERFRNLRSEVWWQLRHRFEKTHARKLALTPGADPRAAHLFQQDELISLPNHPTLIAQISQPLYLYSETGKVQIESKADMKRRGIESPDFADALVLAFAFSEMAVWYPPVDTELPEDILRMRREMEIW